ncbi:SGNH/GDSL hydrolase family protein [Spongiimicrobium salis]|uniref:SGNH/GDSL hydrolase family protein n=1 Tax=Spongiimicrobium salis TaxID=1667022 RepID=UPI00374CBD02
MYTRLFFAFICLYLSSCSSGQKTIGNKEENTKISILFLGNSLTYTNDLPVLVQKSAKERGIRISTKMVAFPNYAIADHWSENKVQNLIASGKYDYVILQQGPSSQKEGREMLIEYGKKYSALCARYDTKLAYFMVWPSRNYYRTFDGVIQNYSDAARINKALLLPVGKVWKQYFDKNQTYDYYGFDQFHPSLLGSTIAAEVIVDHLFPQSKTN